MSTENQTPETNTEQAVEKDTVQEATVESTEGVRESGLADAAGINQESNEISGTPTAEADTTAETTVAEDSAAA